MQQLGFAPEVIATRRAAFDATRFPDVARADYITRQVIGVNGGLV
ncbi:MAG: hypothetical protein WDO72_10410 [Pseudomonadota bacterium]